MSVDLQKLARVLAAEFDMSVYATPDSLQFGLRSIPLAVLGAMWSGYPDVEILVRALDLMYGSAPPVPDLLWPHLMATPPTEVVARPAGPLSEVLTLRTHVGLVPVPRARLDPKISPDAYWATASTNLVDAMPLPLIGGARSRTPYAFWIEPTGADFAWAFARRCGSAAVFLPTSLVGLVLPDPTAGALRVLQDAAREIRTDAEAGVPLLAQPILLHDEVVRPAS